MVTYTVLILTLMFNIIKCNFYKRTAAIARISSITVDVARISNSDFCIATILLTTKP